MPQVRQYDDDKLHGIIANPEMYKASLVDDCRRELEIRSKGAALMPKIEAYDDAGLREVLANPQMYSDEVLYCCQKVDAERRRIVRERQEREAELARLRREQEEKATAGKEDRRGPNQTRRSVEEMALSHICSCNRCSMYSPCRLSIVEYAPL